MSINPVSTLFAEALHEALEAIGLSETVANLEKQVSVCQFPEKGQVTFKVFQYAKVLKKAPPQIAKDICEKIAVHGNIACVEAEGAYINAFISNEKLSQALQAQLNPAAGDVVYSGTPETTKVLVEYSQPNTHKELHIGHARNAVLGDTLCNLFRYVGHTVHAENYHGDEGNHVAKCIWYMDKHNFRPAPDENKGTWLGLIYRDSTTAVTEAEGTENEAIYREEISNVLKQIEDRSGPYYETWKETREWSLDLFKEAYDWLGAHFDNWTCESDVSEASFKLVQEYYEKGIFVKSDGAIGTDLSAKNLGFCLLLKTDGRGLYATKDLALALHRFETVNPDNCIYIVDNRQTYHFQQVFASLEMMGFDISKRCYHLAYELVETSSGAMSSRKGTIVPFLKLVNELEEKCKQTMLERSNGEPVNEEELQDKAQKIAAAAIRYGMIKIDPESKIIFDMYGWLKMEGNTGPYLLYSYVRMQSIMARAEGKVATDNVNWSALDTPNEKRFLVLLSQFNQVAQDAALKMKPNIFANYMFDVARTYSAMYKESPIMAEPHQKTREARLALTQLGANYVKTGLQLLGMPTLSKM